MRPRTIITFERLYLFTLLIGVFHSVVEWKKMTAMASVPFILTGQVLTIASLTALILLVSRRRSSVAKWILVVLFVLGLPMAVMVLASGIMGGFLILSIVQILMQIIALSLLFTPASRAWLSEKASQPTSA